MAKKQWAYGKNEKRRRLFQKGRNGSAAERWKSVGKHLSFGASEAYKLLRTNLMFSMADEGSCKVIGVTSALRGEGKSTTAANLAYTLAQSGKRTLLMEADMRIPVQASTFRLEESPGLSHVLTGMNSLHEAIRQQTPIRTMSILPAGEIPPNPSELLSSKNMATVMNALIGIFDYIIVDLPPINAVSDGLAVSKLLTGTIVVVRQNYCDQQSLAETMRRLEMLEVKLLGFVFNTTEPGENRYEKYGYKSTGKSKSGSKHGYSYGYHKKAREATVNVDMTAAAPAQKPETASEKHKDV